MPLPYARAAVGSANPAKLEAVHRALARLAPGCRVEAAAVTSAVGAQPIGDDATRQGALERARAALAASGADVAFGLEGGVIFMGGRPWLVSWVAVIDGEGRLGEASGLRMPLPLSTAARLRDGEELGDIIDSLFELRLSKQQAGAVGLLTEGFVSRTDAFADLVAMACAPLLRPDLYILGSMDPAGPPLAPADVVRLHLAALNAHDIQTAQAFLAPDCQRHVGWRDTSGRDAVGQGAAERSWRACPDWRYDVQTMLAEGDLVAIMVRASGRHTGEALDLPGYGSFPPTGRQLRAAWSCVYKVSGGRIVEYWQTSDLLVLLRDLGALAG